MTSGKTPSILRINPPDLGTPPGYSQVVEVSAGRIIFIAGQTALDSSGNVVGKNDFAAQAAQVFRNLGFALQASRCTAAHLVKLTVFLTDMDNLAAYRDAHIRRRGPRNRIDSPRRFGCNGVMGAGDPPTRRQAQVSRPVCFTRAQSCHPPPPYLQISLPA